MARPRKTKKVETDIKEVLTDNKPIKHKDDDILSCKITKCFVDKYTSKLYEVGEIYKFSYKRIKEIKAKNDKFLEVLDK